MISHSVTTNKLADNNNNNKPPIPNRTTLSVSSSNISEHNTGVISVTEHIYIVINPCKVGRNAIEDVSTTKTTQILTTPQNDHKTNRQTPTPGCDSSTPKADKARSALTPMPDESPIQPILEYEKLQQIKNKHKHSQCKTILQ